MYLQRSELVYLMRFIVKKKKKNFIAIFES
jgi:hypothetical protein